MGATTFYTYGKGADVAEAFQAARENALVTCGFAEYSGTIAEKESWVIIDDQPHDPASANSLARSLIAAEDDRIDDKWGPAGAIAMSYLGSSGEDAAAAKVIGWLFFGWAVE